MKVKKSPKLKEKLEAKREAKKKVKKTPENFRVPIENMTYRDLKRAVVCRGMEFEEVIKGDFCRLNSWLHKNYMNDIDDGLLDKYDDWLDEELKKTGNFESVHPQLRLGYIGEKSEEEGPIKVKKVKVEREKKEKREKTEEGLFKGTKKALTYQCEKEGLSLDDTVAKVMEIFPDASSKSIKIWFKKSKRSANI